MILAGGDSFGVFRTPINEVVDTEAPENMASGISTAELIAKKYNVPAKSVAASGWGMDSTIVLAIEEIERNKNIKLLFFWLTSPGRIMLGNIHGSKIPTTHWGYEEDLQNAPEYADLPYNVVKTSRDLPGQDPAPMHKFSNAWNLSNPAAQEYVRLVPTYKKYYDPFAYIALLSNFCHANGVKVIYMNEIPYSEYIQGKFDEYDTETYNKIYGPKESVRIMTGPNTEEILGHSPGNHVLPADHKKIANLVLSKHKDFIESALL